MKLGDGFRIRWNRQTDDYSDILIRGNIHEALRRRRKRARHRHAYTSRWPLQPPGEDPTKDEAAPTSTCSLRERDIVCIIHETYKRNQTFKAVLLRRSQCSEGPNLEAIDDAMQEARAPRDTLYNVISVASAEGGLVQDLYELSQSLEPLRATMDAYALLMLS